MTQSWEGKSKGNTLGYRIFIGILRVAGLTPAYFLLRFVAAYYFLFSGSSGFIYSYFRHRLGYGALKSRFKVYRNFYLFGQTLIDKIVVMSGIGAPFTFEFDGEDHIRAMIAGGRGGILISAHAGNYELAGHYFKRLPVRVNIIMVDQEREQIKSYLDSVMKEKNLNVIFIKEDMSHVYEISKALSNNELIALHGDRFLPGNKTLEGSLLGRQARFPAGPFVMATTFKVPVAYVFCFKDSKTHYHLYSEAPKEYTGARSMAMERALSDYTLALESKVRQYPEQWFNYYDFWAA